FPGSVKQVDRSDYIVQDNCDRVTDGTVDMRLGRQVNHAIRPLRSEQLIDERIIGNVAFDEAIVGSVLNIPEISQVAGIRQLIEVNVFILWINGNKPTHYVRSDKSGSSGHNDFLLHINRSTGDLLSTVPISMPNASYRLCLAQLSIRVPVRIWIHCPRLVPHLLADVVRWY